MLVRFHDSLKKSWLRGISRNLEKCMWGRGGGAHYIAKCPAVQSGRRVFRLRKIEIWQKIVPGGWEVGGGGDLHTLPKSAQAWFYKISEMLQKSLVQAQQEQQRTTSGMIHSRRGSK